jgi:integrase
MPKAVRKLARTSQIFGAQVHTLSQDDVRDHLGKPIDVVTDTRHLADVRTRLAERLSAGTARAYRPCITAWWSLCERFDVELHDDALLRGWLLAMTRGEHAWSVSSARVAVAAVAAVRGLLGHASPLADHAFKTWFDGELLAPLAAPPNRKAPILRRHLLAAIASLEPTTRAADPVQRLMASRDRAIVLLGFAAALRRSELAAIRADDLVRNPAGGWVLRIRRSKTDQRRDGQLVPLYPARDTALDAMTAIRQWQDAAGITAGPLFRRIDRHGTIGTQALDPSSIRLVLNRLHLGDDISPHSLRRGFITEARLAGASNVQIRRVSRHKGDQMLDTYTADVDAHVQGPGTIV